MPEQNSESVSISASDIGTLDLSEKKVTHPMRQMGTKSVFCVRCQAKTEHAVGLDKNNEILVVCPCGDFNKFPLVDDPAEFEKMLDAHHEANKGQVTVEMAADAQKEFDERFKKLMGVA